MQFFYFFYDYSPQIPMLGITRLQLLNELKKQGYKIDRSKRTIQKSLQIIFGELEDFGDF